MKPASSPTIIVNNVWSRISGVRDLHLVDRLDYEMSYFVEGAQFTRAYKQGYWDKDAEQYRHWDGRRHMLNQSMVFPTGLLPRVLEFFSLNCVDVEVNDRRGEPEKGSSLAIAKYEPRPYQKEAVEAALKHERGIIRVGTGGGKSPRIGTLVLKYDGTICKVEELRVGDLLMGPDSRPRTVLSTNIQYGNICKITPKRGDPWYCNDEHILTLKHTVTGDVVDISIPEYKKQHGKFKHCHKQFSVGVEFPVQENALPIDPYFLGLWFGDGNKTVIGGHLHSLGITTADAEIEDCVRKTAFAYGMKVRTVKQKGAVNRYFVSTSRGKPNRLSREIIGLLGKGLQIPQAYLTASKEERLKFLAGWIDSDGHLHNNSFEITQKRKDWAEGVAFLARSLGFKVVITPKHNKKYNRTYHRIGISGDVSTIPVRVPRKKAAPRRQKKDPCRTGFKIDPAGKDFFVGIELDGDGRFLLGDFTVTHNTLIAAMVAAEYNLPTMIYVVGRDILHQFYDDFVKTLGEDKVGLIGDGICDVKQINVCSIWTAVKAFNLKGKVSLDDEDWSPDVNAVDGEMKREIRGAVKNAKVAVFDEAHFIACDTVQSIFKASKKCRYVFGMSGTDWRDDGADLLLESVCGPRIFNMPASRLIDEGWLVPPKIAFVEIPALPQPLPKNWRTVYSRYITHNPVRNQAIVDGVRTLVGMGRKVLILIRYLPHGKKLVDMMPDLSVFFVNGKLDSRTRAAAKERFEAGEIQCLIASSVFDIGVDIPSLDALIMAGGGKSTVRVLQRIGRVIRPFPGKTDAIVMEFLDNARYLDKHSATRLAVYQSEPRFQIQLPQGFDRRRLKKVHLKEKIKKQ